MRNVKMIIVCTSLGLMTMGQAADELAATEPRPLPFAGEKDSRAIYAVHASWVKFRAGDAIITWKNMGDLYEITCEMRTTGAAAALYKKFNQTQISRGRITDQGLVPETYVNTRNGKEVERMAYNWTTLKATINTPGNQREFDISAGAQDVLTLPYQLAYLAASSASWPRSVQVGTGKRVNAYQITLVGESKKETAVGTLDTWQFKGVQDPADSSTEIWVSKHPYLVTTIRFINPETVNLSYDIEKILPLDGTGDKPDQPASRPNDPAGPVSP